MTKLRLTFVFLTSSLVLSFYFRDLSAEQIPARGRATFEGYHEPIQLSFNFNRSSISELRSDLESSWNAMRAVVESRETSSSQKAEAVDGFFRAIDGMCVDSCEILLQQLQQLSDSLEPFKTRQGQESVDSSYAGAIPKDVMSNVSAFATFVESIERGDQKNPGNVLHRLRAAVEVVHTVVALEQGALFKLMSSNPADYIDGARVLQRDIHHMTRSALAINRIVQVLNARERRFGSRFAVDEAKVIVAAISDLGLFYIKLAQSLSNLAVIGDQNLKDQLKVFQDSVEPMNAADARDIIIRELGRRPDEIFVSLDLSHPLKCGSVSCTYLAKIKNAFGGLSDVVVKVRRNGLKEQLDYNRKLNKILLKICNVMVSPATASFMDILADQISGLEDAFEKETDFRIEMRNLRRFRWLFALNPNVVVPKPYASLSTEAVLVMEKMNGGNLDSEMKPLVDQAKAFNWDVRIEDPDAARQKMARFLAENPDVANIEKTFGIIMESVVYMVMVAGELHADLHPGNVMVAKETGKLAYIDFAQTMDTRGLASRPLKAAYHLYFGDADGLAKDIHAMSADREYPLKVIKEAVKTAFQDHQIDSVRIKELLKGHKTLPNAESLKNVLSEIIQVLYRDKGYRASPKYIQFIRSALPVASSLIMLEKGMQPFAFIKTASLAVAKGLVLGSFQKLALFMPAKFSDIYTSIEQGISAHNRKRRGSEMNTTNPPPATDPVCSESLGEGPVR